MRFVITLLLATAVIAEGLIAFAAAGSMNSRGVEQDDIIAALVIGGLLTFIGLMLVYGAFRVRRLAKQQRADFDAGQASALVTSVAIGTDLGDTFDASGD